MAHFLKEVNYVLGILQSTNIFFSINDFNGNYFFSVKMLHFIVFSNFVNLYFLVKCII